ncbi:hypothetical protein GCK32_000962 [Trichostrongylus colubriformis]|uniref:Uncharacterized protein n=1 Tax=Trichostrongylus colubriformis TaxID=6319 RepID=A0AAN8IHW4_TRICO
MATFHMELPWQQVVFLIATTLGNIVVLPSSSALFAVCVICYVLIVKYLLQNTSHHSGSQFRRHELRLGAQVAGLVIAFMVQFVYNSGTYLLNSLDQTLLRRWKTMGPLAYGFLSYIHPWTCLAFNQQIRNGVFRLFCCCFRYKVDLPTSSRVFSLSRARTEASCV